ncbi:MAG: alpha-galactosidase [Alicyclobacillus sp.]|nr:alpha-galactosidase [Alicyclobacillus sp.]
MGVLEDTETGLTYVWQIEHNGSWHWEIGDDGQGVYLLAGGPTEECGWSKVIGPGEVFHTVPVSFAVVQGGFEAAIQWLTMYRRDIVQKSGRTREFPVIFNDYMNCLFGDPTEDKLLPLIDAAADLGCEYFCIDAGWYAEEGDWWNSVGNWKPSSRRFPSGFEKILERIRSRGMVPGIWIEIEVVGRRGATAPALPDSWFFYRHGNRVSDHGRFQLDFRNAEVRTACKRTIQTLVEDYGIGYLKLDYNINAGLGTDVNATSPGQGLLEHNRAYLSWLDDLLSTYPHVVIENCASGGLRMDYATLARCDVQSLSDQTDYKLMSVIACASPTAALPEQCGIWAYPKADATPTEVITNMVNALPLRIHLSGQVHLLGEEERQLIKEAICVHKSIRSRTRCAVPFWPLGLPAFSSQWAALGLKNSDEVLLAVWRRSSLADTVSIPLGHYVPSQARAEVLFPQKEGYVGLKWHSSSCKLSVRIREEYGSAVLRLVW